MATRKRPRGALAAPPPAPRSIPVPPCKRVPATALVVDHFTARPPPPWASAFLLTHFHADHYGGLTRSWAAARIYASAVTARLVRARIGVDAAYLRAVPLGVAVPIDEEPGVTLTAIDANHCPGAVMFLLVDARDGSVTLHSGDTRAASGLVWGPGSPLSRAPRVNNLYLDTTYCDARYAFPDQAAVLRAVAAAAREAVAAPGARPLLLFPAYTIGKERVVMAAAEALGVSVRVDPVKAAILRACDLPDFDRLFVTVGGGGGGGGGVGGGGARRRQR